MKTAIAIRHVHFEDLGSLAPALERAGYQIRYADYGVDDIAALDAVAPDLVVVLGGPIGAYEDDLYPSLKDELNLLEMRLGANRPTIGICLGAQLMARALGARVYPTGLKEIGWGQITIRPAGCESAIRHLVQNNTAVLHWHGDTFDLPAGATLLASTEKCRNQAFVWGNALGFQFHPEATAARLEQWFIGHACEIAGAKLAVASLRADTARYAERLEIQARKCFDEWLTSIENSSAQTVAQSSAETNKSST
ncbi:glutamine amidotransferase [Candidatus Binatus sp.]|uniref:glutamine amidotransferase n=1 Tax=Candidatus Binatus sp. TaxID=2811406 RepID=UPI003CC5ED31